MHEGREIEAKTIKSTRVNVYYVYYGNGVSEKRVVVVAHFK